MKSAQKTVYAEKAWLVGIVPPGEAPRYFRGGRDDHSLDELASLVQTAGAHVVGKTLQPRETPHPRFFVGTGKVTEIARLAKEHKADVVIFDHDLSASQIHNLEKEIGLKVIDRTELILDIFATHARSSQAKLQVELAQLEYALPRLRRMWTHITGEQQAGGFGIGIGQRGPGEKQIEVDRRIARKRITDLKREIATIEQRKQSEVKARANENFTVSLVGYTNAGKSTLMKALTGADVYIDDKLFSTLDTRTRMWTLGEGLKVLLSDTVGFIRNLPHDLVSSFQATLEEVSQADLLLHVVDASHPEAEEQIAAVNEVLHQLKCDQTKTILLFNKVDRFRDPLERTLLTNRHPQALCISAATGTGLEELHQRVREIVAERLVSMNVSIPLSEGRLLAELAGTAQILSKQFINEHVEMTLRIPSRLEWKLQKFISNGQ